MDIKNRSETLLIDGIAILTYEFNIFFLYISLLY